MNKMKVIGASKDTLSKLKDRLYERLKNPETFSDERYKDRLFIKFVKLLCDISYNLAFFSLPASNQFERFYRMYELLKMHKEEEIDVKMVSQDGMAQLYTVSSDMPFLLHTLLEFMRDNNLSVRFVIHPIFGIKYDEDGNAIDIEASSQSGKLVSSVHIDLFGSFDPDKIKNDITLRLKTLKAATSDFHKMKDRLGDAINRMKTYPEVKKDEVSFLNWLLKDNFIFTGYRSYEIDTGKNGYIKANENSLGILRIRRSKYQKKTFLKNIPEYLSDVIQGCAPLNIAKTNHFSPIERKERMNFIGIAKYDKDRKIIGRDVFLGIFSDKAFSERPSSVPALKAKLSDIVQSEHLVIGSHDYRETLEIFNSMPKHELFLTDNDDLLELINHIVVDDPLMPVRVFINQKLSTNNILLIVIFDNHLYNEDAVARMAKYLKTNLNTDIIDDRVYFQVNNIVRIHYYFNIGKRVVDVIDLPKLEKRLSELLESWQQRKIRLIKKRFGTDYGRIISKYLNAFDDEYIIYNKPSDAVADIEILEEFVSSPTVIFNSSNSTVTVYSTEEISLATVVPLLSNINIITLDEKLYHVHIDQKLIYVEKLEISLPDKSPATDDNIVSCTIENILNKIVDNDKLNQLTLSGLSYNEIDLIRAVRNYLVQLSGYGLRTISAVITSHPKFASDLISYFNDKFNPAVENRDSKKFENILTGYLSELKELREDTILRSIMKIFFAMIRTNYYQDRIGYYISFKIKSDMINFMKSPVPLYEIYVHSHSTDGIHLRADMVSRGGIRYSNRPDDFREEILDLMNTQVAKNSIIIPSGSKGGFVIRHQLVDDKLEQIKNSYSLLMRGLLDITDNIINGKVVHPANCVIYDGDDPYLVVAADKGTAWLSDRANELSEEYNFWLFDAFASGGKDGYDHKKEGITARGAFESVKWHFAELGIDFYAPFTVVGTGDMSGDVFGNGLLCSDSIKLVAAFNHLHIFLDPNPDPKISFIERKRMFELPHSSWDSYNESLISKGGGVFARKSKSINLSEQIKKSLGTDENSVTGEHLIQLILSAPVDLLYNGGIGTYIKDIGEQDSDVADRANDGCRITADKVRAKVVAEGGNLGITMKARIKIAQRSIRINTDAVDNSGGVNLSDHEVNLKILFKQLMEKDKINLNERNNMLQDVKDSIIKDVLTDNKLVNLMLSLEERRLTDNKYLYSFKIIMPKIMGYKLFLPITRPQLSLVSAYERIYLKKLIASNDICSNEFSTIYLQSYFPDEIIEKIPNAIKTHPLKNTIIATQISNRLVNFLGIAGVHYLSNTLSKNYTFIIKTILVMDAIFDTHAAYNRLISDDDCISKAEFYGRRINKMVQEAVLNEITIELTDKNVKYLKGKLKQFFKPIIETNDNLSYIKYLESNFSDGFFLALHISEKFDEPIDNITMLLQKIDKAMNLQLIESINNVNLKNEWDYKLAWQIKKKLNRFRILIFKIAKEQFEMDMDRCLTCEIGNRIKKEIGLLPQSMDNLHPILVVMGNILDIVENETMNSK